MNFMNNRLQMTQSEFATHMGVGRSAVSNWKKSGHLVWIENEQGQLRIDVVRTEARLAARVDSGRGRPKGGAGEVAPSPEEDEVSAPLPRGGERDNPRMDLLRQQVIEKSIKNQKAAGELVVLAEFERRAAEMTRQARERVMSVVRTMAERLATETDPRRITLLMEEEMDRTFNDLASAIDGGGLADDDLAEAEVVEEQEGAAEEEA